VSCPPGLVPVRALRSPRVGRGFGIRKLRPALRSARRSGLRQRWAGRPHGFAPAPRPPSQRRRGFALHRRQHGRVGVHGDRDGGLAVVPLEDMPSSRWKERKEPDAALRNVSSWSDPQLMVVPLETLSILGELGSHVRHRNLPVPFDTSRRVTTFRSSVSEPTHRNDVFTSDLKEGALDACAAEGAGTGCERPVCRSNIRVHVDARIRRGSAELLVDPSLN
jgi:hypothetical protein